MRAKNNTARFGANAVMMNPMNVPTWLTSSKGFRPVESDIRPSNGPDTNWQAA